MTLQNNRHQPKVADASAGADRPGENPADAGLGAGLTSAGRADARQVVLARRDAAAPNGVQTASEPVRVRWAIGGLACADGHDLRAAFTASVRALPDPIEQRSLTEVLMGGKSRVTADDVSTHFAPTIKPAAIAVAKTRGAEAWMAPEARGAFIDALKSAAAKAAFAAGLEVMAPFELELDSPTYDQQRLRDMQRKLAEERAADQVEHFARAADLLKQFQSLREAAPELSAGQVLDRLSPAERGSMLQTLLLASSRQQAMQKLWVVAGPYLVRVDTRSDDSAAAAGGAGPGGHPTGLAPRPNLNPLPPTLGPLRSVQPAEIEGRSVLLVGARGGFMVVDPHGAAEPEMYADPSVQSQLGFSRVVYLGAAGGFAACHGEAGVVRWSLGNGAAPVSAIRPDRFALPAGDAPTDSSVSLIGSRSPGPRNLQALDERRLVFSVGNRLWLLEGRDLAQLPADSEAEVIAIVPTDQHLLVIHEDGAICAFDRGTRQLLCTQHRGGRLRSAGALPWLGGSRLLLAAEEGPIECIGLDDPLITQYRSPHRGLRVVSGSADLVAAVSADRSRLLLWNTWDGAAPAAELYLTALTKHRAADLAFV